MGLAASTALRDYDSPAYGSLAGLGARTLKKKPVLVLDAEELEQAHMLFQQGASDLLGDFDPAERAAQSASLFGLAPMSEDDEQPVSFLDCADEDETEIEEADLPEPDKVLSLTRNSDNAGSTVNPFGEAPQGKSAGKKQALPPLEEREALDPVEETQRVDETPLAAVFGEELPEEFAGELPEEMPEAFLAEGKPASYSPLNKPLPGFSQIGLTPQSEPAAGAADQSEEAPAAEQDWFVESPVPLSSDLPAQEPEVEAYEPIPANTSSELEVNAEFEAETSEVSEPVEEIAGQGIEPQTPIEAPAALDGSRQEAIATLSEAEFETEALPDTDENALGQITQEPQLTAFEAKVADEALDLTEFSYFDEDEPALAPSPDYSAPRITQIMQTGQQSTLRARFVREDVSLARPTPSLWRKMIAAMHRFWWRITG